MMVGGVAGLSAVRAERRFVLLTATRWLPVGVVFGLTVLLPLQRGLSLTQVGVLLSIQGFVVLGLELPTGGLADRVGRRPVLIASGVVALLSTTMIIAATGFWMFVVALVLQGVFRALDSGPLEAWFVDTVEASGGRHSVDGQRVFDEQHGFDGQRVFDGQHGFAGRPGSDGQHRVERGLSRASTVLGLAIAGGAVVGGALVAWRPLGAALALTLPFGVALGLYAVHTVLVTVLVREQSRRPNRPGHSPVPGAAHPPAATLPPAPVALHDAATPASATWNVLAQGVAVLRGSRVLRALVLVEVFWSVAMIAFETLTPVQLADTLGGEDAAAAVFGPASAVAWGLFAVGSHLAGVAGRRFGVAVTALAARVLNGAFVVGMGLIAGPVGLLVGYGLAYLTHGAAGPMHSALLHREASPANRAVMLSINSTVSGGSYSLGLLVLAPLAGATSPGVALVVAGLFSMIGALLYIPAFRQGLTAERPARVQSIE